MFNFPTQKSSNKTSKSVIHTYDGQVLDKFTIKSKPGFNISSIHKYEFYIDQRNVRVRYCRVCGRIREIFNIDGKDVDYAKNSMEKFKGGSANQYNFEKLKIKFENILTQEYQKVTSNI